MSTTSHASGYGGNINQQHTAPSTPSSTSGGPGLTYAYPGAMSTPASATGNSAMVAGTPGAGAGGNVQMGPGSRIGSAAASAANSPFMSPAQVPGPSHSTPGMLAGEGGTGGVSIPMQNELQRMVQSGRNTPVQRTSPSPAPNTAPVGAGGGMTGQSMGRSVSMMDMNQWARMSAQQSFMQQQHSSPLGQWAIGLNLPQGAQGTQDGSGNPIPRPASSSPTSNPHSGFHPSSFGPTPMQLGLHPGQFASSSMASDSSYSGMGGAPGAGFDPGMSMSISPPNWNWAMPGASGGGIGSYGANGYIAGGNGSFVGSYGGNMMGTSFGRERDRELEARWGREFVCCGNNFGGMHQLLEHYEEEHAKTPADARAAALNALGAPGATMPGAGPSFPANNSQTAAAQASSQSSQPSHQHGDVPAPPGMMDIEMEEAPPAPPASAPPGLSQTGNMRGMMPGMGQGVTANRQIQGGAGNTTPLSATGSTVGRSSPLQQQHQPQQMQLLQMGHFPPPPAPGPPVSSASALAMHPALGGGLPLGHSNAHGLMSAPVLGPHGQGMGAVNNPMAQQSPWAAAFRPQPTFVSGIQPSLLNMPGMGPMPGPGQAQGPGPGQAMQGPGMMPHMGLPAQAMQQLVQAQAGGQRAVTGPGGLSINTNFGLPGAGIAYSHSAPQTPAPSGPSRAGTPSGSRTLSKEELEARAAKRAQKKAAAAAAALSGGHDAEDSDADHGKGEDKKFPCPIEGCGKVYKQANGLKYHLTRSINSGHGNLQVLGSLGYLIGEGKGDAG